MTDKDRIASNPDIFPKVNSKIWETLQQFAYRLLSCAFQEKAEGQFHSGNSRHKILLQLLDMGCDIYIGIFEP
jgi:hypothetical protein